MGPNSRQRLEPSHDATRAQSRMGMRGSRKECVTLKFKRKFKRRSVLLACVACAAEYLFSAAHASPAAKPLIVGIVPNLSPRSMLSAYQPLREQLALFLARPVELFTAPDFKTFYLRSAGGEYDLALMPAHLARLAQIEAGLVPVAQFIPQQTGVALVAKQSRIRQASDLLGKRIALVDSLALVTLRAEDWLRAQGLVLGGNVPLAAHFTYHNAAVQAVINGNADAAIISSAPFATMPPEMRAAVRIVGTLGEMPTNVFMANPQLSKGEVAQLQRALLDFGHQSGAGRHFLARYRYQDIVPPSASEMQAMDSYAKRAKQIMTGHPDPR